MESAAETLVTVLAISQAVTGFWQVYLAYAALRYASDKNRASEG